MNSCLFAGRSVCASACLPRHKRIAINGLVTAIASASSAGLLIVANRLLAYWRFSQELLTVSVTAHYGGVVGMARPTRWLTVHRQSLPIRG